MLKYLQWRQSVRLDIQLVCSKVNNINTFNRTEQALRIYIQHLMSTMMLQMEIVGMHVCKVKAGLELNDPTDLWIF